MCNREQSVVPGGEGGGGIKQQDKEIKRDKLPVAK